MSPVATSKSNCATPPTGMDKKKGRVGEGGSREREEENVCGKKRKVETERDERGERQRKVKRERERKERLKEYGK